MKSVRIEPHFASWREAARSVLAEGWRPEFVQWSDSQDQSSLFATLDKPAPTLTRKVGTVPRAFMDVAELVACARFEGRWDLLYRMLFRISEGDSDLLKRISDADVHLAFDLAKSVKKDIHKMHAFVRFKVVNEGQIDEHYVAWHKPEHLTVRLGTPFFERRFGDKPWTIFTPDESASWNGEALSFGPGIPAHEFQTTDSLDEMWKSYYKSIFNPARIKLKAMRAEMAPKYWSHLPETEIIRELVRKAPVRLQGMAEDQYKAAPVPTGSLEEVAAAARACQACPIHHMATQTVFGVGPANADVMIIGEQPGDDEDLTGVPFSGPAGQILDEALRGAGLARESLYVTNAVKHFKHELRGKMRIHKKPTGRESETCRPWLEAEIARVQPKLIFALGATAGTAILGRLPSIAKERGHLQTSDRWNTSVILSWHPAAILRAMTPEERTQRLSQLTEDLRRALSDAKIAAGRAPNPAIAESLD